MIVIDTKQLAALEKRLGAVSKNAKRDMGRALTTTQRATKTETIDFGPLGRAEVRRATVIHALHLLVQALRAEG